MSAFPNHPPGGELGRGFEPTSLLDPRLQREVSARRWEIRAAQWRTLALAEAVFGEGVSVRLAPYPGRGPFRGMFLVEVPFGDLERHRRLEGVFTACAGLDPVLSCVPSIFVFEPRWGEIATPTQAPVAGRLAG
jgi:hypothetical protein